MGNAFQAHKLAREAHAGQRDKRGELYIYHLQRVAKAVKARARSLPYIDTETALIVAYLHDVVEDTDITIEQVERGYGTRVAEAVEMLTHPHGITNEEYLGYIYPLVNNPIAKLVKICDIEDNLGRIEGLKAIGTPQSLADYSRLRTRYQKALRFLLNGEK